MTQGMTEVESNVFDILVFGMFCSFAVHLLCEVARCEGEVDDAS